MVETGGSDELGEELPAEAGPEVDRAGGVVADALDGAVVTVDGDVVVADVVPRISVAERLCCPNAARSGPL